MLHLWTAMLSVNKKLRQPEKYFKHFVVFEASKQNILLMFGNCFACHNGNVRSTKRFTG